MTEKEKLKEIIETALGFHDYYKVVVTEKDIDRLTDKLIENEYGNVAELKVELRSKVDYIHELWEVKEDYKRRAETAEAVISDLRSKLAKAEHDRKRYKTKIEELRKEIQNES